MALQNATEEQLSLSRTRAAFYKKVIERYREAISVGEQKTIPQLKELILPNDDAVQKKKQELLEEIGVAEFEKDFLKYASKAAEYCHSLSHIEAQLPAPFWLSPKEIVELHAADEFDGAILLCSLLQAAGCDSAAVRVLQLEGSLEHPIVVFSSSNKHFYADVSQSNKVKAMPENALEELQEFSYEGKKFVSQKYEFDEREYVEF